MKRKKITAVMLVISLVAGLAAGCGNDTGTENVQGESSETGEVLDLTYYNADTNKDDPWTDPVAEKITEATGVKLTTSYPLSDASEDISLMIANDEYPDIIYAKGFANQLVEAGALIDMTELIEEYGPNIKKMYGDELNKLRWSKDDTAIYQLSSYTIGGSPMKPAGNVQIQWKVLEENNYEYPTTLEEYETMIKEYLAEHPTTDDGLPMIGISLSASDWRWMIDLANPSAFIAEGSPDTGEWLVQDDDTIIFKYRSEKVKEYFRWLSRMYDEGILDPDFATKQEFYNLLCGLNYIGVAYKLKMGGRDLEELSPGERGIVLLVFYLALSKNNIPIIIDQPEDNLDNQSVYSKLVPCICEAKKKRQVIIVTHNPNIAIACDAEQIVYCHMNKTTHEIQYKSGAIEEPEIRKCVVDVLEGTYPAFDLRKKKYFSLG